MIRVRVASAHTRPSLPGKTITTDEHVARALRQHAAAIEHTNEASKRSEARVKGANLCSKGGREGARVWVRT